MAWLEKRGECFHVCLRLGERKFKRSLKTTNPRDADIAVARVERRLKLIDDGDVGRVGWQGRSTGSDSGDDIA